MKRIILLSIICCGVVYCQEKISLDDAFKIALKQNQEILKTKEEIAASKGRFWSGISLPQPELSVEFEYAPNGKPLNKFGERTIGVSQSFEFPTNYFLRGSKLNVETDIAETEYYKSVIEVLANVKRTYFNVKAKEEHLKIAKINFDLADEFDKKAGIRYDTGEGTYLEKLTANVQRTQATSNVDAAKKELAGELSNLIVLLGISPVNEKKYELTDSLVYQQSNCSVTELEQSATEKNPLLKKARLTTESYSLNKSLAWSSLLPGISLSYYKQAVDGGRNDFYGASFGISVPIWFLFDQRGQIEEASAELKGSEFEYDGIRNSISANIVNAFLTLKNEERGVILYKNELLPQSDEIYRTASVSYDAGEIGYLEFLQSKQTLTGVQSGYIDALFRYNEALITIEEITGKILDEINLDGE